MDSALKAQEENIRLHNMVAAMRSNFGAQLQMATSNSTSQAGKNKNSTEVESKGNKRGIADSEAPQSEGQHALPVSKSQQSKQQSRRLSLPARVSDKGRIEDSGVLDGMHSMDLGADGQRHSVEQNQQQGATLQRLKVQSTDISHKDSSCKTPSDASTNSSMGGEHVRQFQQLEGLDSLLDAELPTLTHPAASCSGMHKEMSQKAAEDPFAASEILASVPKASSPASAQLASQIDSCLTSAMHDSTGVQGDFMHSPLSANASRPVAAVPYMPAHAQQYLDSSSHSAVLNSTAHAPLPLQQQQHNVRVPWHQQQLQQHIMQQQQQQPLQHQDSQQLAQCVPPWDHSSFMGVSSFMGAPTGVEGPPVWPPPVSSNTAHMHGSQAPQMHPQAHSSQLYIPHQHSGVSSVEHQHSMVASSMSDMGTYASAHTGGHTDAGHLGQPPYAPMQAQASNLYVPPVQAHQQIPPAFSLPAQPGNPFASAMTSGSGLAQMRSTSFAT